MKELETLLSSLNQTVNDSREVIQGYDAVKDSFLMVKTRASNIAVQGMVFDFSEFEKRYNKALSANDFDGANSVIHSADGAMDVTANRYSNASAAREEMEKEYENLSKLDIPRKQFIDVMRKTDKFFEDGKYKDVIRMSEANIQDMQTVIEWQKASQQSIKIAREALLKGKKAGSKMEISGSFLEQAESAFNKGDYEKADDLAQESSKEALSSNEAYTEALGYMNDARKEVNSFGNMAAVSTLKEVISNMQNNLANEQFREVKTDFKKVILQSKKLREAIEVITEVREEIDTFGDLADISSLQEGLQGLEDMLDNGEFNKFKTHSKIILSQCVDLRKSSKPVIEFDFDRNSFVLEETKKLSINFENKGNAAAKDFSFEILDEEWAELMKISKNIEQLDPGEKEDMVIYIKFKEKGQAIPFSYNIKFKNALTSANHNFRKEEEVVVYASSEQVLSGTQNQVEAPKRTVQYTEWIPQATLEGGDANSIIDYLSRHRESYLRSPNNRAVIEHLRRTKYNLPLYFEIPEEPNDLIHHWGLPRLLRGNVILNDDRDDVLKEIVESSPDKNYVILGEPGVGKTVLLFQIFDEFMANQPTGYLSNSNLHKLIHSDLGLRMFYDDLPENTEMWETIEKLDKTQVRGLVVSSRKVDWNNLPSSVRDKFIPLIIEKFKSPKDMYDVCKSMLDFSAIKYSESAVKLLVDKAEGSPIYVYSMIKELREQQGSKARLQDDFIEDNAKKRDGALYFFNIGALTKEHWRGVQAWGSAFFCLFDIPFKDSDRAQMFTLLFHEIWTAYFQTY